MISLNKTPFPKVNFGRYFNAVQDFILIVFLQKILLLHFILLSTIHHILFFCGCWKLDKSDAYDERTLALEHDKFYWFEV